MWSKFLLQTAALAQKTSEAIRVLELQEDVLQKELRGIQHILLAMQVFRYAFILFINLRILFVMYRVRYVHFEYMEYTLDHSIHINFSFDTILIVLLLTVYDMQAWQYNFM